MENIGISRKQVMKASDLGGIVGHYIEPIAHKIVRLHN